MVILPAQPDRGRHFSAPAAPRRPRWAAWLLLGCMGLHLAAGAQEAEPLAPVPAASGTPAPASAPPEPAARLAPPGLGLSAPDDVPTPEATAAPPVTAGPSPSPRTQPSAADLGIEGLASFYARKFTGRRTASGEIFDPQALTMAHPSWPFGTAVRVTHVHSGRSVVVRVNDRGPHVRQRIADLSPAAAKALGMMREGVSRVRLVVLPPAPAPR